MPLYSSELEHIETTYEYCDFILTTTIAALMTPSEMESKIRLATYKRLGRTTNRHIRAVCQNLLSKKDAVKYLDECLQTLQRKMTLEEALRYGLAQKAVLR